MSLGYRSSFCRLAMAYREAHLEANRDSVWVPPRMFPKFDAFEYELRKLGIRGRDYARYAVTVILPLVEAASSKYFPSLPFHVFLSQKSLQRYAEHTLETGRDDIGNASTDHYLVQCEAIAALRYVTETVRGKTITMDDAASHVRHGLSDVWWNARRNIDVTSEVISMLRIAYRMNGVQLHSYDDVVAELLRRGEDAVH